MWGLKLSSLVCLHMEIQNPKMLNVIQLQMSFMCMFSMILFIQFNFTEANGITVELHQITTGIAFKLEMAVCLFFQ